MFNIGLLFWLASSYDIVYLQSITWYLNNVIRSIMEYDSDYHVNLGSVITCDWRVSYWTMSHSLGHLYLACVQENLILYLAYIF